jgi:predicted RNA-binding Zn-ribbon protein involved in translation (DUF1610 family)
VLDALLVIAMLPAVVGAIAVNVARRERRRQALRCCPVCGGRAIVRALPRPPRDQPRYRRTAIAFRCADCGAELFELVRPRSLGPLAGEQLDSWLAAGNLPVARLHRR